MKLMDFYDKIAKVFNDVEFIPDTLKLPNMYDNFTIPIKLPLQDYLQTRDKTKDSMVTI